MPCTSVKVSEKKEPVILTMIHKHIKHEMAESPRCFMYMAALSTRSQQPAILPSTVK